MPNSNKGRAPLELESNPSLYQSLYVVVRCTQQAARFLHPYVLPAPRIFEAPYFKCYEIGNIFVMEDWERKGINIDYVTNMQ